MLEGIANGSVLLRAKQCEVQPLCAVTSAVPLGCARHVPHAELRDWPQPVRTYQGVPRPVPDLPNQSRTSQVVPQPVPDLLKSP